MRACTRLRKNFRKPSPFCVPLNLNKWLLTGDESNRRWLPSRSHTHTHTQTQGDRHTLCDATATGHVPKALFSEQSDWRPLSELTLKIKLEQGYHAHTPTHTHTLSPAHTLFVHELSLTWGGKRAHCQLMMLCVCVCTANALPYCILVRIIPLWLLPAR